MIKDALTLPKGEETFWFETAVALMKGKEAEMRTSMKCDICHEIEACRIFYQSGYEPDWETHLCEACYQDLMKEMYPDVRLEDD